MYELGDTTYAIRAVGAVAMVFRPGCHEIAEVDLGQQLQLLSATDAEHIPAFCFMPGPTGQHVPHRLSRMLNKRYIDRAVRLLGKQVQNVAGDGHCMYHSIRMAVVEAGGPERSVAELRRLVVQHAGVYLADRGPEIVDSCVRAARAGLNRNGSARVRCPEGAWGGEDSLYVIACQMGLRATLYCYETGRSYVYDFGQLERSLARDENHY